MPKEGVDRIAAIVPAAGTGQRFGPGRNKPLHSLRGKPLLIWVLEVLQDIEEIGEILPVVKDRDMEVTADLVGDHRIIKVRRIVAGGRERQDSVFNGLKALDGATTAVLIHDGVRPLIERELVRRLIAERAGCDGVIAGVPVKDTIKEVGPREPAAGVQPPDMIVRGTLDRSVLWAIQTPQVFPYHTILAAYERAMSENHYATDDAALVERYGGTVKVIMGSYRNIKITTPEDIPLAEALALSCA